MENYDKKVLIVGGGVSGLFAALRLAENGVKNIEILEADDRIGGRVNSFQHGDGVLELGAQWIHGRGDCPLWKFVKDNQIPVTNDESGDGDGTFYLPGGNVVPKKLLKQTLDFSEKTHDYLDKFAREDIDESIPLSVGHFFEERIKNFLSKEMNVEKVKIKKALLDWFIKWEEVDTGVDDLKKQSVLSWGEYIDYELDGYESEPILEGGYSKLVQFLAKSMEGKVTMNMSQKVTKINWNGDLAVVRTESGLAFDADYVILALPLGVLKETHMSLFEPQLPQKKIEIIEQLGFGVMDKIFLEFEEAFWDTENPGIQLVMTDIDYHDEDLANAWQNHIAGFDGVCGQPNVLCGWVCGEPARTMETLSEEEVKQTCWSLLRKYVGDTTPCPKYCKVSSWGSNKLFRGSYSYRPPSCDELSIGPWTLSTPVMDKEGRTRLFFAGEATDTDHYGTVTGAMMAGSREGGRVLQILQGGAGRD
eukprot:TRINITY_DN15513_c0_g1_i2.p1 TRINITY_DN15513_c0_g1~~TRINITY_DN15513_c0_g1_i2.p1  ORF type:complete len:476 (-),score=114.85 TRINITY_DN15513_c0_g1_i2:47-1474(-)